MEHQARALHSIIEDAGWCAFSRQGQAATLLDVACGIGTQALALASLGCYAVTASDVSPQAIARLEQLVAQQGLSESKITACVADMCNVYEAHGKQEFDVVICCDNSLPHLLSNDLVLQALQQFYRCLKPGGGVIVTLRDYDPILQELQATVPPASCRSSSCSSHSSPGASSSLEKETGRFVKFFPYGIRRDPATGSRYIVSQLWEFEDASTAQTGSTSSSSPSAMSNAVTSTHSASTATTPPVQSANALVASRHLPPSSCCYKLSMYFTLDNEGSTVGEASDTISTNGNENAFEQPPQQQQQQPIREEVRGSSPEQLTTHVFRTRYHAIRIPTVITLMKLAGFQEVKQLHADAFVQPVVVGTKVL